MIPYSLAEHGPIHWPMPHPGVWLREAENPDRERYWRLQDAELHETAHVRTAPVDAFETFPLAGRECVWLDVAEPAGQQRLFAINTDATMTGLDHWRSRA